MLHRPRESQLFPYTTLFRSIYFTSAAASDLGHWSPPVEIAPGTGDRFGAEISVATNGRIDVMFDDRSYSGNAQVDVRSEEHTSELQSRGHLVCRLLLEKKKH